MNKISITSGPSLTLRPVDKSVLLSSSEWLVPVLIYSQYSRTLDCEFDVLIRSIGNFQMRVVSVVQKDRASSCVRSRD